MVKRPAYIPSLVTRRQRKSLETCPKSVMGTSSAMLHSPGTETTWVDDPAEIPECTNQQSIDGSIRERIQSGLTASTRQPSQLRESAKLLGAGGIAGAFSKTCTAPLARLTILYQVHSCFHRNRKPLLDRQVILLCFKDALDHPTTEISYGHSLAHRNTQGNSLRLEGAYRKDVHSLELHFHSQPLMLQVQGLKTVPSGIGQLSLGRAFSHVIRQEGLLALWKGNGVTVVHRIPYSAFNFWAYERITELWRQHVPPEKSNPGLDCARRLASGGLAGGLACAVVS